MYNFVIFGSTWDLYKISYSDVIGLSNVKYVSSPYVYRQPILKFLFRLHWTPKINKYMRIPFKSVWNSGYYKDDFKNKNSICFVFFYPWCVYQKYGLLKYLRKKYPNSKMVCFFQDLIDLQSNLDINKVKAAFDLVLSFDHAESKKYRLLYHQLVFSCFPVEKSLSISYSDIYFLGKAKNRLDEIIKTYKYLKAQNLRCDFYLVGVELDKQVYYDEIHYINGMPYIENLQHIISSRCLLEIMQHGGYGYTQRMCEAIAYDKKILTNNVEVKNAPFYNEKYVSVFKNEKDIDVSFLIDKFNDKANYNYKEKISPKELLSFIEEKLINCRI